MFYFPNKDNLFCQMMNAMTERLEEESEITKISSLVLNTKT